MTQEDKQLLLSDLCGRLPYGVIIAYKEGKNDYHCWTLRTLNAPGISKSDTAPDSDGEIEYTEQAGIGMRTGIRPLRLEKMLQYLRPMSSMTEKENEEYNGLLFGVCDFTQDTSSLTPVIELTTFFYSHHIDCCGLIEKGLALEAPKDMYRYEND
jgi:hypothetical protein